MSTNELDVHEQRTADAERRIEAHLKKHPENLAPVFKELQHLRHKEGSHFHEDLTAINKTLEERQILPHMQISEEGEKNFAVTTDNKTNSQGERIASQSVSPPQESQPEKTAYERMGRGGINLEHNSGGEAGRLPNGGENGHCRRSRDSFQSPQGEHKTIIDKALKLCRLIPTAKLEKMVEAIIQHESRWDHKCINTWDVNAKAGQPTQGLMQVRPDVFKEWALPGYNSDINDPLSNIVAGVRYAQHRYKRIEKVPGVVSLAKNDKYSPY